MKRKDMSTQKNNGGLTGDAWRYFTGLAHRHDKKRSDVVDSYQEWRIVGNTVQMVDINETTFSDGYRLGNEVINSNPFTDGSKQEVHYYMVPPENMKVFISSDDLISLYDLSMKYTKPIKKKTLKPMNEVGVEYMKKKNQEKADNNGE